MQKYRNAVASTWKVRRRNRLTPARRLGCEVQILHFTGPTLESGRKHVFVGCGTLQPGYIHQQMRQLDPATGHIWAAVDANGLSRGYVLGYQRKVDGVAGMHVDVVCSGAQSWVDDTARACKHVGIHLLHRVEKDTKRMGLDIVYLDSVRSAVRFYARMGYQVTLFPCAFQAAKRKEHGAKGRAGFQRGSLGGRLARYVHGRENLTNEHLQNLATYKHKYYGSNLVSMSKCLRKGL